MPSRYVTGLAIGTRITTVEAIRIVRGAYYANRGTPVNRSPNARDGRDIMANAGVRKIGTHRIRDDAGHWTTTTEFVKVT